MREVSEDRDDIEETFVEWQVNAEKGIRLMQSQGIIPEKVLVDVEEFLAWCSGKGLPPNGESRSEYAAWLIKENVSIFERTLTYLEIVCEFTR